MVRMFQKYVIIIIVIIIIWWFYMSKMPKGEASYTVPVQPSLAW